MISAIDARTEAPLSISGASAARPEPFGSRVAATRDPKAAGLPALAPLIDNGASVRGSIALIKVAKAHALLAGRSYISPHDVKTIAHDVLRHRILPSYEAEAQGRTTDHLVEQVLENVPVP